MTGKVIMQIKKISLKELDLEDQRFRFTLDRPDEKFIRSVKEVGIIEPIIIIPRKTYKVLVSGWKRVEAARVCRVIALPALELEEKIDDLEAFTLAFFVSYGQRQFSLAEKALAAKKFHDFGLGDRDLIGRILPHLELPPERRTLRILLELSSLGEGLEIIHRKDWKLNTAEQFLNFSDEERKWLLDLVKKLTHNEQKEIVEMFSTLRRRKNRGLKEICQEPEIASCLELFKKGRPEAGGRLLSLLRKESRPQISGLNNEMDLTIKGLRLPQKVNLEYDRTLEKSSLRLVLEVESRTELEKLLHSLTEKLRDERWQRLFEILNHKGE